jgi:hypothetical protein
MCRSWLPSVFVLGVIGVVICLPSAVQAQEKSDKKDETKKQVEEAVVKGLEWLKRNQAQDGHWDAQGNYSIAMTALAGMCFLMEGSTLKEGKYTDQVQKAVQWFLRPGLQRANGLFCEFSNGDAGSYMHGHGFATMFLACVYGEEEDKEQREKLEKSVKRAVEFIAKAQTTRRHRLPEGKQVEIGGWGYVSAADTGSGGFDEGSVTVTQMQALRAARNAGIAVPKETIDKAVAYLEACTTPKGGVIYSYAQSNGSAISGQERPPITAAAICCSFGAGQYKGELCKKWISFCKDNIPYAKGRVNHDEYQSYYFSQVIYVLGDDRYGAMFPKEDKNTWLTWSKYKETTYPYLTESQDKTSGAWTSGYIGPVFTTSVNLTILQLEKGILPIYQR